MSGMTRDRLEELRRIAEQATPGPWEWNKYLNLFSATGKPVLTKPFSPDNPDVVEAMPEDLDYIERFNPETVLALLDEIERLRRERETLAAVVEAAIAARDAFHLYDNPEKWHKAIAKLARVVEDLDPKLVVALERRR